MMILGILCISICIQNYPSIAELEAEMLEFPEYAGEILAEIAIFSTIGMIFLVIGITFIVTATIFVYIAIKRSGGKK